MKKKIIATLLSLILCFLFLTGFAPKEPTMDVYFLNVARSVCVLCVSDGKCIMLDSGNTTTENPNSIATIKEALKILNINTIDCMVLSHGHGDHTGGAQVLLQDLIVDPTHAVQIKQVIYDFGDPNVKSASTIVALLAELNKNRGMNIIETIPQTNSEYQIGTMKIKCLLQNEEPDVFNSNEKENDDTVDNQSIITKVSLIGTDQSLLFMGDALGNLEQKLIDRHADLTCSIIQLSHHGLDTSSIPAFLKQTKAKYGVACTGGWDLDPNLKKKCNAQKITFKSTTEGTQIFHCKNGSTILQQ